MSKGRGITVTHKPTNTRPTNEFYRMARLARATAWQRVEEKRKNGRTEERSIVLALPRFPASPPATGSPAMTLAETAADLRQAALDEPEITHKGIISTGLKIDLHRKKQQYTMSARRRKEFPSDEEISAIAQAFSAPAIPFQTYNGSLWKIVIWVWEETNP